MAFEELDVERVAGPYRQQVAQEVGEQQALDGRVDRLQPAVDTA